MAVERRDPLPAGRYWIFIRDAELPQFQAWAKANSATVSLQASQIQTITPDSYIFAVTPTGQIIRNAEGEVIVFSVSAPTPWVRFGFPTIVKDPKLSPAQVIDKEVASAPDPDPYDPLGALGGSGAIIGQVAPWLVLTVLGVVALRRLIK